MMERIEPLDALTGQSADEAVSFSLDGKHYSVSLTSENAEKFRETLKPWCLAARVVDSSRAPRRGEASRRKAAEREEIQEIRAWARSQGVAVAEKGRISHELKTAYLAAHTLVSPDASSATVPLVSAAAEDAAAPDLMAALRASVPRVETPSEEENPDVALQNEDAVEEGLLETWDCGGEDDPFEKACRAE